MSFFPKIPTFKFKSIDIPSLPPIVRPIVRHIIPRSLRPPSRRKNIERFFRRREALSDDPLSSPGVKNVELFNLPKQFSTAPKVKNVKQFELPSRDLLRKKLKLRRGLRRRAGGGGGGGGF